VNQQLLLPIIIMTNSRAISKFPKSRKRRELYGTLNYCIPGPIRRIQRTYSRRRKQEVLLFLNHHRIHLSKNGIDGYEQPSRVLSGMDNVKEEGFRRPTAAEARDYFLIRNASTIQTWWAKRDKIFAGPMPKPYSLKWPALEKELMKQSGTARDNNRIVTVHWFRRVSHQIWQQLYPQVSEVFVFSNVWFWRFLRRHGIVRRRITKVATKTPAEMVDVADCFIQYIRRNNRRKDDPTAMLLRSSPFGGGEENVSTKQTSMRRFPNNLVINLDETPLPFEFLNGYSYDFKGAITVAGKSERSGWDKRQATIIPYIMADGSTPFKPVIIFHGKGTVARREHYDNRVDVHFNETAYNNEDLFYTWLQNIYQPYVTQQACGIEESLIIMDAAAFHETEAIRTFIKQAQPPIRTAIIPPGLTSLVQPLDTAFNGPFKQLLHEEVDLYLEELEKRGVCPTPGL
jgi:hypothetical protein